MTKAAEADNPTGPPIAHSPLPSFVVWSAEIVMRTEMLLRAEAEFKQARLGMSTEDLAPLIQDVFQGAALETGSIEGLYRRATGVTLSLIEGVISAERAQDETTEGRSYETALIEGQRNAYDMAFDIATGEAPISESLIRQIHEATCAGQDTYRAKTSQGWQTQSLPKGEYKQNPNNVLQPDGSLHNYCPVIDVAPQMEFLVNQVKSQDFVAASAVTQAAYLHHAFTHVHPFADGNGRTARVLASIPLIRSHSLPLVVLADQDSEYRQAQAAADVGDTQAFVSLIEEMVVDLLQLLAVRVRGAGSAKGLTSELAQRIASVRGGQDSHIPAAERLLELLDGALATSLDQLVVPAELTPTVSHGSGGRKLDGYDQVGRTIFATSIIESLSQPTRVSLLLIASVAKAADGPQPVVATSQIPSSRHLEALYCRVNEIYPRPTQVFRMRLRAWVDEQVAQIPAAILERLDN